MPMQRPISAAPYHKIIDKMIEELESWKRERPAHMEFSDCGVSLVRKAHHYIIEPVTEQLQKGLIHQ